MESDYVLYPGVHTPEPIDNFLQQSHLQLKGTTMPWTTTTGRDMQDAGSF
jgi:hypothetical protein